MNIGSAVCIQTEVPLEAPEMTVAWRDEVGVLISRGPVDAALGAARAAETRILFALGAARPGNNSHAFEQFDRAAVLWMEGESRPLSVVTVTGGLAEIWVSGPISEMDAAVLKGVAEGGGDLSSLEEELLRTAMDVKVDDLIGFIAAWAALERLIAKSHGDHLARFVAIPADALPASLQDVQDRLLAASGTGPGLTSQFLILVWALSPGDIGPDEAAFRRLNRRRQAIYHRGDTAEVRAARDEAVRLLMRLYALAAVKPGPRAA